ncbi:hypothetical protein GWK47_024357 [Chionoecetes opilio]|uniref:Uncharacterized protein n=1 Tax=Chionoecetes opilio TaxID=41210 RepID=A0A8J5CJA0_CHIOP|nr:hypothetical protein GWK47_024357 [Chionoecetes opilio]
MPPTASWQGCIPYPPDRSRLVTVDTEAQAHALLNLKDLDGNPFDIMPDIALNTCTGTISIPPRSCPVDDTEWSECADVLFDILTEDYDAVAVYCYTIPPRGRRSPLPTLPKSLSKGKISLIAFMLPGSTTLLNLTALLHASASPAGVLATLPSTADPLPAVLFVLNLAMLVPRVLQPSRHVPSALFTNRLIIPTFMLNPQSLS